MKSLSTVARTDEAKQKLKGSNCHSYTKAYYVDDNGVDQLLDDLTYPIKIKKYSEPPKYANVAYNPAAAECEFHVINKGGIYSPKNTDSDLNDVLVRDRVVKFYDGKYLQSLTTESSKSINLATAYLFYTKFTLNSGGSVSTINIDRSNTAGNADIYFTDWFPYYDAHKYGSVNYSPDAYCLFKIDRENQFAEKFTKFVINANSTKGTIWYKVGNDENEMKATGISSGWISGGSLVNGDATITINKERGRYLWVAVIYEIFDLSTDVQINSLTFYYQEHIEWTLLGTFLLDDPGFPDEQSPKISVIKCNGRNAYKKALETKQNIEDLSAGVSLDALIKTLCDLGGITYTSTSIDSLSSYGNRTLDVGYGDEESIDVIFEDIMTIIGKDYRMRIDDQNVMYVEARPTGYLADWVFSFKRYKQANQKFVGNKQLQRFGIVTNQKVLGALEELSEDTFLSGGAHTATWSGNAMAKYWIITVNAGDGYIDSVKFNPTSAVYTLLGSLINVTVKTWGCKYSSGEPTYMGEAANVDNIEANNGFRSRTINPLMISNAECKSTAEDKISEFGVPAYDIDLTSNYLNMLVEMNDQVVFLSEDTLEDSLFEVKGIEYVINSEVDKRSMFKLTDTGRNWSDQGAIVWDRNLYGNSTTWKLDVGIFYDSKYPIGSTQSEILALTTYHNNTDFN